MPHAVTFDDVWKMFQETDRQMRETDIKFQKNEQYMRETAQYMRETAQYMRETAQQMRETDIKFQKTEQYIQENARLMRETDIKFQKTEQLVKDISKQIGNLGGRWGEFVEGLVSPACIAMFTERGITVDEVYTRVNKTVAGERMEIDILVANTTDAVLVEVKSHLQVGDVRAHLHRLGRFKPLFPRYATCHVYGAVAGIAIDNEAKQFAMDSGLFVIAQSGDTVNLTNAQEFTPKIW